MSALFVSGHNARALNEEGSDGVTAKIHGPSVGIFFGFIAIIVGLLFTWVMNKTIFKKYVNLPYTVIVFFFGIMASVIATNAADENDSMVVSTKIWMNMDPDLMLYALLPPLLFSEAMQLDSHQVRMAIVPAAVLALPGAAFGAYMQGLVCYYWLPYDWTWLFCFMVGSVLSATDPVSVVNMLKSVRGGNTSTVKLTYLITGESLLNDGTALVIFEILVSKEYDSASNIVIFFVKVLTISPLLGFGLGGITLEILKLARRRTSTEHTVVQIAVTVSCAYISFFLAQYILGCSGIICCCAAGVIIAWKGPALILQPEQMEIVWHMLEWVGNTMIFAMAGLIVGKYSHEMEWNDILCIIIIYTSMTLIRAVMLSITFPLVKWFHNEYTFKDVIFSTFGGLRGAIALALVLTLEKHLDDQVLELGDVEIKPHARLFNGNDGRRAMFIICGVVTLTVLINGSFAGSFFTWLYNSRLDNEVDEIIFHYVEKRIRRRAREFIANEDLPPFDADEVKALCSVFNYHYSQAPTTEERVHHKEQMQAFVDASAGKTELEFVEDGKGHFVMHSSEKLSVSGGEVTMGDREDSSSSLTSRTSGDGNVNFNRINSNSVYRRASNNYELRDDLIIKFRVVFHGITRHCYMRQVNEGRIVRGSGVALTLLHASRHGLEMCDTPGLHDLDSIIDALAVFERERTRLSFFKDFFRNKSVCIFNYFRDWDEQYERDRVFIITSFLEAHNYAQKILVKYLGERGFVDTPEEQLIIRESTLQMRQAQKILDTIDEHVVSFHATEMVARMVLNMADDVVTRFQEEGILNPQDSEDFFKKTFHDMKKIGTLHHRQEYIDSLVGTLAAADKAAASESSNNKDVRENVSGGKKRRGWSWSRRNSIMKGVELTEDDLRPQSPRNSIVGEVAEYESLKKEDKITGPDDSRDNHAYQWSSDGRSRLSLHMSESEAAANMLALQDEDDENVELVSVSAFDVSVELNKDKDNDKDK